MRVVLDTNVAISALLWNGSPRRLLELADVGMISMFLSPELMLELVRLLSRSRFSGQLLAQQLTVASARDRYVGRTRLVVPTSLPNSSLGGSRYVHLLACAVAAHAELLITGDHQLLNLSMYAGTRIMKPAQALRFIGVP